MLGAALVIGAVVIVAILIVAAWSSARRHRSEGLQRSDKLREQFGPEYDRTVAEMGDIRSAEDELTARQERVSQFDIRHLAADEGQRFNDEWQVVQASFVDDPSTAVHDADALVGRVMAARGYPICRSIIRRFWGTTVRRTTSGSATPKVRQTRRIYARP
jgi:FtsZ-interacting cell division protein ZipA